MNVSFSSFRPQVQPVSKVTPTFGNNVTRIAEKAAEEVAHTNPQISLKDAAVATVGIPVLGMAIFAAPIALLAHATEAAVGLTTEGGAILGSMLGSVVSTPFSIKHLIDKIRLPKA